jgi:myo-inositol-1(or 4)-monophosphatase
VDDLAVVIAAARAGAVVVREHVGITLRTEYKSEVDPVTQADKAAEAAIVAVLRSQRPKDAILAEEGGLDARRGSRRWIIDPLDGTVNYVHGMPHFAVSVALADGDGPLAACTIDPLRGEEFTAIRGGGAHLNERPITVAGETDLPRALVVTGFPYDRTIHAAEYATALAAVLARVQGVRRLGSATLDFAWVACGRFDAYWEFGLAPWDQAAGILLVREAGGIVTDHTGADSHPESHSVICANPQIHALLRPVVAAAAPAHFAAGDLDNAT